MRRGLVPLALAFALVLSGCLAAPATEVQVAGADVGVDVAGVVAKLSPLLPEVPILHEVLDVETSVGVINVDVYRPDTDEPVPLILVASPYNTANSPLGAGGKDPENENWIDLPLYAWIREQLIPRGYAFAQMDILGTRYSGGCMGLANSEERRATAETIDALGSEPWTNGKVAMIGKSYLGNSQVGAAVENPEHLVAIVPISPPTREYSYHYYNGVPYLVNTATQAAYYGGYSVPPPVDDPVTYGPRYLERVECMPEGLAYSAASLGTYDAYWADRDARPLIPQTRDDIAVWFIHGHQDWNVKPDHIVVDAWPGPTRAQIGQWAHDYPNKNNWDVDAFGDREDWYFQLHRWFDLQLKGIDSGLDAETAACPVETQGSDAVWRCVNAFPPTPATDPVTNITLFPTADGALAWEAGEGTATFADGAARTDRGVAEQVVFTYTFEKTTRVVGPALVNMSLSTTSATDTYLTAALAIERDGKLEEFDWGFQSLRHRGGIDKPEPVVPGTMYDVAFETYAMDHVFQAGDTLALVLRGAGEGPNLGVQPSPSPGVVDVDLAKTSLTLPTMPLDRVFVPLTAAQLPAEYAPNTR